MTAFLFALACLSGHLTPAIPRCISEAQAIHRAGDACRAKRWPAASCYRDVRVRWMAHLTGTCRP